MHTGLTAKVNNCDTPKGHGEGHAPLPEKLIMHGGTLKKLVFVHK